jgi:hypothetical protein
MHRIISPGVEAAGRPRPLRAGVLATLALITLPALARGAPPSTPTPPLRLPLPEARRTVRMMDDIYKAGVISTHRMYVQDPGTASAVAWAKQVLKEVKAKGWPETRIFTTSERPMNPENRAADPFERDAGLAFNQGKASFERVEGGVLRYATPVRATEKSCLLGGLSYRALLTQR